MQAAKNEQAILIPRGELRVDPKLNPRFIFKEKELDELGDSLAQGQVEPLIVRKRKDGKGYDVGAGARRLAASERKKLPELLCIVRELSDAAMLEMSVQENAGREDLHPLEEGAAFVSLNRSWKAIGLDKPRSVEDLAATCGKTKGYVLGRMRLAADLSGDAQKAFADGRFGVAAAMALLVAGSKPNQDVVLRELTGKKLEAEVIRDFIRHRFLLRLADARFPVGDAALVPDAGPCGKCPKNSANQPELFVDAKIGGDALCTDPACFEAKKAASNGKRAAAYALDGQEEVPAKEAKAAWLNAAKPAAFIPGDDPLPEDEKRRTLDALLGRDKVQRGFATDPSGWLRSLVRRGDAVGGLRRAGHAELAAKVEAAGQPEAKEPKADSATLLKVNGAVGQLVRAAENAHARVQIGRSILLAIVGHLIEQSWAQTLIWIVQRRKLDDAGAKGNVRGRARAMLLAAAAPMEPPALFALAVELVAYHDALVQAELKGKAREGRPLWALLDAYAVDVLGRSAKVAKPPADKKPKAKPAVKKARKR